MRDGDSSKLSRRERWTDPKDARRRFTKRVKFRDGKKKYKRCARESAANKMQADRSRESVNTWIRTVIHTCVERFERHNEGTSWDGGAKGGKGMDTRTAGGRDRRGGFNHVK